MKLLSDDLIDVNYQHIDLYGWWTNVMGTAALHANKNVVQLLLDRGAECDTGPVTRAPQSLALTPLYLAAFHDHLDVVKLLLDAGADANKVANDGYTPMYCAVRNSLEMVKLLINSGAS